MIDKEGRRKEKEEEEGGGGGSRRRKEKERENERKLIRLMVSKYSSMFVSCIKRKKSSSLAHLFLRAAFYIDS